MLLKENRLWTILGFILVLFFFYFASKYFIHLRGIIIKAGFAGPVVAILIYGIFAPTPITTDPLTIISGALFGPFLGVLISWLGNNLAASVEYYLGRHINRATNFKEIKNKLPLGLHKLPIKSPLVLILGRIIPGYGGKIISILAGIYDVPIKTYIWTTAVVNLIGSIFLTSLGFSLINLLK